MRFNTSVPAVSGSIGVRDDQDRKEGPTRPGNHWWLILVVIGLISLTGCASSRQSSGSLLTDNGRFMNLWKTYVHCYQGKDLETIRADAQRLNREANSIDSDPAPTLPERHGFFYLGQTDRLSIDPAAMAADCALHAGQVAQGIGRLYIARDMFRMVILYFSQPRYQFYVAQARLGLEHIDATSRACREQPHFMTRCRYEM
jgi:hypothetical protein